MNDAAYASELDDLEALRTAFPDLPGVALDAAAHRIRQYRNSAIAITSARAGSIVLLASVSALCLFVLQQTLGETLKEAWLGSASHQKIKKFLIDRRCEKSEVLADDVKRRVGKVAVPAVELLDGLPDPEQPNVPPDIRIRVRVEIRMKMPPRLEDMR